MIAYILNRLQLITAPGDIKMRASETVLSGWLECNGGSYPVIKYPALFTEIGYTWGGSGANFNVPDFRGTVPRGWNHSATPDAYTDPDFAGRAARYAGGQTGDRVGSYQTDGVGAHTHPTTFGGPAGAAFTVGGFDSPASTAASANTSANTGNETRSKNAYVMFVIKT